MAYHPVASIRSRNRHVEALRQQIPLNTYLFLMHQAATMGAVPILNEHGQPTGQFSTLDTKERMDTLKYLTNKAMPDLKSNDVSPAPGDSELLDAAATANMTTEELIQTIRATPAEVRDTTLIPSPTRESYDP